MPITCYHCGGTDFLLVINEQGESNLQCVHYGAHLELPVEEPSDA
ncbi:hypothetical protein [Streptomyces sp. NBC_00233]|nr:hypothetical protein [Streptomyces sp. NBC_00233]MCX5229704.1 hypothetical protein [Streptomyces sp. NBC_00233]